MYREYVEKKTMDDLMNYINRFYSTWKLLSVTYDEINQSYIAILETTD